MKKTLKLISFILALTLLAFSLMACGDDPVTDNTPKTEESSTVEVGNQSSGKVVTIVVGGTKEKVYSVDYSNVDLEEGVLSVFKYLGNEGLLSYKADDTGYGAFLTEVGDLKQDAASGTYIYLYTSIESDQDVSAYATEKVWNGTTLVSSGVGITSMKVENGAIIYVGTIKY